MSDDVPAPRPGPAELWTAVVLFAVWALLAPRPLDPYDYWEHLVTGQRSFAEARVIDVEPYAAPSLGRPFVNMYWLSEAIYAALHLAGGVPLTIVAHALATVLAWSGVIFWIRARGHPPTVAPLAAFAGFCLTAQSTALRPQLLAAALTVPMLALLRRNRAGAVELAGLAGILVLWTNLHPSVLAAAFMVGLEALALLLSSASTERRLAARTGVLWIVTASMALLCHPSGWRFVPYVLRTSGSAVMRDNVEWMPLDWHSQLGHVVALLVLYGVLRIFRWRTVPLRDAVTPLVLLAASLFSSRFALWAGFALPCLIAHLMPAPATGQPVNPRLNLAVLAAIAGLALWMTPWLKASCPLVPAWRKPILSEETPIALADEALARCRDGPWFHAAEWGDYLIYRAGDRHPVFMYCRFDRFPAALWADYLEASGGAPGWEAALARHRIAYCLVSEKHQGGLLARLRNAPGWESIYVDANGAIFRRR